MSINSFIKIIYDKKNIVSTLYSVQGNGVTGLHTKK